MYYFKIRNKDFLPTVPKSLWSGLGLNLGPSSFLPFKIITNSEIAKDELFDYFI